MSKKLRDRIFTQISFLGNYVDNKSKQSIEIESRLGFYARGNFTTDVGRPRFIMTMEALDSLLGNTKEVLYITSEDYGYTGFRHRVTKDVNGNVLQDHLETKYSQPHIDSISKWTRYAFSLETEESKLPEAIYVEPTVRNITRTRYYFAKHGCYVDLSREEINNFINYRIEVEMNTKKYPPEKLVDHFLVCTRRVTMMMLGSRIFYRFKELQYVCFIVNTNVTGNFKHGDDPLEYTYKVKSQIMAQPWSLKMDDLQKGKIIGGKWIYDVCHKTDGVHFLFVITHNSIWLINSPYHYNLVSNESYGVVAPNETTILEVEVLNPFNHDGYKMHVIDSHTIRGNSVRHCFRPERLRLAKEFLDEVRFRRNAIQITGIDTFTAVDVSREPTVPAIEFPNHLFDIEFKTVSHFTTLDEMYDIIRNLLAEQESGRLGYDTDGLIFTPVDSEYDFALRTDKESYSKPKIYKWKPPTKVTIDFLVALTEDEKPFFMVADRDDNKNLVPFPGTVTRPFDYETMIDQIDMSLVGGIGEFAWNTELGKFQFVRTRETKASPNALQVAVDNWLLVRNPLGEDAMTGRGMGQLRYYHNQTNRDILALGSGILLDLGSGMGGTVNKWDNYHLVFAVEPETDYIIELRSRAKNLGFVERRVGESINITERVIVIIQGYAQETEKIRNSIFATLNPRGDPSISAYVDTVSMIDVGTFFWESYSSLTSVVNTINSCLKLGGRLIWKMMDGDAVRSRMNKFYSPLVAGETLKYSDDFVIECTGNGDQINFAFKGGIAAKQIEYLTRITDFYYILGKEYKVVFQRRADNADNKYILTGDSLNASSLYIYGILERTIPEGYVDRLKPARQIPEEIRIEQPVIQREPLSSITQKQPRREQAKTYIPAARKAVSSSTKPGRYGL